MDRVRTLKLRRKFAGKGTYGHATQSTPELIPIKNKKVP